MRRKIPPLTTLRPFEAAARLGSFTAAADELSITQGAVSLQVRNLEAFLGKQLFERKTRKVELTEEGRQFAGACQRALDELERVTRSLLALREHSILTVSSLPTLTTVWLMPKLNAFAALHPDIEVRVATSISPVDLRGTDIDIAIRVGRLPGIDYKKNQPSIDLIMTDYWEGVVADYLFEDTLVPVMSRKIIQEELPIKTPEDIKQYPLIHTASRQNAWRDWFASHGMPFKNRGGTAVYGHFFMALHAASEGKGIALVPNKLLDMYEQRSLDLCLPLPAHLTSAGAYYMLIHESRTANPAVQKFRSWMLENAQIGLGDPALAD